MTTLTHELLRELEALDAHWNPQLTILARLARLAIAADEMNHNPRNAQEAALRDLLIEQGLRK